MEKSVTGKPREFFWDEVPDGDRRTKLIINEYKLLKFLESAGYRKYYIGDFLTYVRIKDKILSITSAEKIKDFTLSYVRNLSDKILTQDKKIELEMELIEKSYKLLSKNFFSLLSVFNGQVIGDSGDSAIFYFANCIVKVTAADIKSYEYKEFDGFIWKEQIIKHDFYLNKEKSDFLQFLNNICRGEEKRLRALITSIGYLLHSFNIPSISKAIVYCDESLNANSGQLEGRTGKSLVVKAISHLRKTITFDGKNFKVGNRFAFQSVDTSTQILNFNDVRANFNFESLFSILTEGLMVEKKNKDAFTITFEDMPKVVITTNFTIQGRGGSFEDRLFEVEFSDFYNSNHKPKDDFKNNFFFEWSKDEWNQFYNAMLKIVQYYLKNGLQKYQIKNLAQRKIIQEIGEELFNYFEDLSINKGYNKRELYSSFVKQTMITINFQQRSFTLMLRSYANYKGCEMLEWKSDGESFVKLVEKNKE